MTDEIDLIIKLRDAGQIIADACSEYLEKQAPTESTELKEEPYNSLPWEDGRDPKGPYQRVRDDGSELFRHLKAILQNNKKRRTFSEKGWNFFYWQGSQDESIFRRKKQRAR